MENSQWLFEVVLIPRCSDLRKDLEPRYLTYSSDPHLALRKVLTHLGERPEYHDPSQFDYAVSGRTVLE